MITRKPLNPEHWQPLTYTDSNGSFVLQMFAGAHYGAEVSYKRLGLIQPNSVKAVANGGAAAAGVAATGSTFRERFKSMWLIKKEQEMIQSFEAEAAAATKSLLDGRDDKRETRSEPRNIAED